jgi:hypothetical protein
VPHIPHELGLPVQVGPSVALPVDEANTDSFFESFGDPQRGHFVPFQSFERMSISLSFSHFSQ